jgi:hypothetical protein
LVHPKTLKDKQTHVVPKPLLSFGLKSPVAILVCSAIGARLKH